MDNSEKKVSYDELNAYIKELFEIRNESKVLKDMVKEFIESTDEYQLITEHREQIKALKNRINVIINENKGYLDMLSKLDGLRERRKLVLDILIVGIKGLQLEMFDDKEENDNLTYEDYVLKIVEQIKIMKRPKGG